MEKKGVVVLILFFFCVLLVGFAFVQHNSAVKQCDALKGTVIDVQFTTEEDGTRDVSGEIVECDTWGVNSLMLLCSGIGLAFVAVILYFRH